MKFDHEISNFLSTAPLYTLLPTKQHFDSPWDLQQVGFKTTCKIEKSEQTHTLDIYPDPPRKYYTDETTDFFSNWNQNGNEQFRFVQQYRGTCQSCKNHFVDFLIEVCGRNDDVEETVKFYIRKLGQFPANEITPDKELVEYLAPSELDLYKKALMNLQHGFGIGAFAYFRRVVEKEILRLLTDISMLESEHSDHIKELLNKHQEKKDMSVIVKEAYQYLPETLKRLGENPFKLLYGQLSVGIHQLTEEDCLKRAQSIDELLKFVIRTLGEEKSEVPKIKESIRYLKQQ